MRFLRNFIRKTKYNLRFLNKNKKAKLNYTVNASTNNELTELMNNYGSDKGNKDNHHNYSEFYSELFFNNRKKVKNFLEIGLGTNDVSMASNMGKQGSPLASLRAWRDFFENAKIYGADIDKKILKNENKIKTFYVDQTNPETIKTMFENIGVEKFDIILEDGLHKYEANICFFENAINYLSDDGVYIIEDVYFKDKIKFINYFEKEKFNYSIVDIYHEENIANNCIVLVRKNV